MLYIVHGSQIDTVKSNIKKIVKSSVVDTDDMNYVRFSYNDVSIFELLDEVSYIPLGYDKKVVVYEDFLWLTKIDKKSKESKEYKALISYLSSPNEQTDLILVILEDKIDDKSEIYKAVENNGRILSYNPPNEVQWKEYAGRYLKEKLNVDIDRDALIELSNRTFRDIGLLKNNAQKLALYTNHITYQDVVKMVERPLEDNVFQIFNALLEGKNGVALQIYRDLRINGVEPVSLITTLANQLRTFSMVSYLTRNNYSIKGICEELNIKNEIRAKILSRQVYNMKESAIKRTFDELYNLDYQIKSGQVDRFYAFELFLANFKVR